MNERFKIEGLAGAQTLVGEIPVSGAKNAVLQALAATLLFKDTVRISNVPDIEDVHRMIELLESVGMVIEKESSSVLKVTPPQKVLTQLSPEITKRFRASVVLTGSLLAREGEVVFPHPGGCIIGARPIDIFIEAFEKLGAQFIASDTSYTFKTPSGKKLKGTTIFMRKPSVTGTQAIMMAAVLAEGETVIKNAALEPETEHLAAFLNECGARIAGAGTTTITVVGTGLLQAQGKTYVTLPDRIEAGSFLILAALCGKDISITNCIPAHNEMLLEMLEYTGSAEITHSANSISVKNNKPLSIRGVDLKTHEYPGFSTDLQAPFTIYLTQATGESVVFETIFEGRLSYIESLVAMGATIKIMDPHRALINGPTPLRARNLESPDIRAGLAFVIAALVAKGTSSIHNVYYIDRGYDHIEKRLSALGAQITRISE
jgi:UDP-N-acetylglucosamine 1-carboxyvinyltransferase